MYFTWGDYTHPENEVDISSITVRSMHSARNRLMFKRWTMTIQGEICEPDTSALTTRLNDMEVEYNDDLRDAILHNSDGSHTNHALTTSNSINGVRVINYSFPRGGPGEYATGRRYSITFQADYMDVEDDIYSFQESLAFYGLGGPLFTRIPTRRGVRTVQIYPNIPQWIYQRGVVIGLRGWPKVPPRMWGGGYEHLEKRYVKTSTPRMLNRNQNLLYPLEYRYVFTSPVTLNGYPAQDYPGYRS